MALQPQRVSVAGASVRSFNGNASGDPQRIALAKRLGSSGLRLISRRKPV
jgi:hypothetical protein